MSHQSGLGAVERELSRLHSEWLRVHGAVGPEGRTVRLSVMTLVAVCADAAAMAVADETVAHLAQSHPHRAIIIAPDRDSTPGIEADLALHGDAGQVLAEVVRLRVGGDAALHLASVVTPLLLPDVPVDLWVVGALPLQQAFGQDAIAICERMLLDTAAYAKPGAALRALLREAGPDGTVALADLAWARIRSWREQLAQMFDPVDMRPLVTNMTHVELTSNGDVESTEVWLLLGWLAASLGWQGKSMPSIELRRGDDPELDAGELLSVRLHCEAAGHNASIAVTRRGGILLTGLDTNGSVSASRTMPLDTASTVHLVAALLEEAGEDPSYRPALRQLGPLAEGPLAGAHR